MDEELENKVYQISEATNPDGTVDAEIDDVHEENGKAIVEFFPMIPGESKRTERMDWPNRDTDDYKLVRLAREIVGDFSALPQIENARVKVDPDTWLIQLEQEVEEEKEPFIERHREHFCELLAWIAFIGLAMMFVPIIFLLGYPFGLRGMTIGQGLSFMISGFIVAGVFSLILDGVEE